MDHVLFLKKMYIMYFTTPMNIFMYVYSFYAYMYLLMD